LVPVVLYDPPPPEKLLCSDARVCQSTTPDTAPVESFPVTVNMEIGVMSFALIPIVPVYVETGV
jgi:hypothetical protein